MFLTSSDGVVIRTAADSISRQKRDATGVKIMNMSGDTRVSAVEPVPFDEENGE